MLFLAFVDSVESLLQKLQAKLWLSTLVLVTKPVATLSAKTLWITALKLLLHFGPGVTSVVAKVTFKPTTKTKTSAPRMLTNSSRSFH